MQHTDSAGNEERVHENRLMMMGAGSSFFHEEFFPEGDAEMLQVFIRPEQADLEPQVQFWNRELPYHDDWQLLAGPAALEAPLTIRQAVAVYDFHSKEALENLYLPQIEGMTPWLYVMDGSLEIDGRTLKKGDAVTGGVRQVSLAKDSHLVLFLIQEDAPMTLAGNFSGVKR